MCEKNPENLLNSLEKKEKDLDFQETPHRIKWKEVNRFLFIRTRQNVFARKGTLKMAMKARNIKCTSKILIFERLNQVLTHHLVFLLIII